MHSAMLLKMTLDFISFTRLHISWISLQIFKLPVMGWAAVPFMQGAGGASFFCQKREEDKLPVVPAPAQGWHLSPLWTPQILVLWVFQLFHGGMPCVGIGKGCPKLLSVVSVPALLLEAGEGFTLPQSRVLSSTEFNCISKNGNARKVGCSLQIPASTYL